ncbi:O-antigen ligase family protein [Polynucleobacter paneuropaeus]|nr:O-antigen ligase family protein [Polynucleobacter paneuropaeus]
MNTSLKKLIFLFILINLILILLPDFLTNNSIWFKDSLIILTNFFNPLFIVFCIIYYLLIKGSIQFNAILISALLYTITVVFSSIIGNNPIKNIFIGIYFFAFTIFIFTIYREIYFDININILYALILWQLIPLILILDPDLRNVFIDDFENSYHGFSGSRVEYGLWSLITIILLVAYKQRINQYIYLTSLGGTLFGLFLSQSRSSFIALGICLIYKNIQNSKHILRKFIFLSISSALIAIVLLSWEIFGRENVFVFLNQTRVEIFLAYLNGMTIDNLLLGNGGQVSITLEGGQITQAHNLLLQWLVNWGVMGLISLCAFIFIFWSSLRSLNSKYLFIAFFFYSFTQPIQGTANFFGPVTMIYFLLTIGLELDSRFVKTRVGNV